MFLHILRYSFLQTLCPSSLMKQKKRSSIQTTMDANFSSYSVGETRCVTVKIITENLWKIITIIIQRPFTGVILFFTSNIDFLLLLLIVLCITSPYCLHCEPIRRKKHSHNTEQPHRLIKLVMLTADIE